MPNKLRKGRDSEISDLAALRILRSAIDPKRPVRDEDWDKATAAAIDKAHEMSLRAVGDEIPEGFFTALEYAERKNIPLQTADARLRRLVAEGEFESVKCFGKTKSGLRRMNFYGLPRGLSNQ